MTSAESIPAAAGGSALDRHDLSWWGMSLFIATEAALFVYLTASYFYVGSSATTWPPTTPGMGLTAINTILLLVSSGSAIIADRSVQHGRMGSFKVWLTVTIILGATFLTLQLHEFGTLELHPQTNAYGSFFYLITGLHGAHVAAGIMMLVYVLVRAFAGHFDAGKNAAARNAILYWHFVDVVWLVVFTSLYLLPRVK